MNLGNTPKPYLPPVNTALPPEPTSLDRLTFKKQAKTLKQYNREHYHKYINDNKMTFEKFMKLYGNDLALEYNILYK